MALDEDGHGEDRAIALPLDEAPLPLPEAQLPIGENIARPHRTLLEIAPPRRPFPGAHAQVLDEIRGEPDAPVVDERPRLAVEAKDAGRPRPEEGAAAVHDDVEHALHIEGGADGSRHLHERAVLRVEGLEPPGAVEQTLEREVRHDRGSRPRGVGERP